MLRCQPWRTAQGPSSSLRHASACSSALRSSSRLPNSRPVRCEAAPDGGSSSSNPPSRRRLSSLEQAEQERLQSAMLGQQAQKFGSERSASGGNGAAAAPPASAAHQSAAHGSADPSHKPEPGSWEDWMQYFYSLDDVVGELDSLQADLDEAVAQEDYKAAAALKAQRQALEAGDWVAKARAELEAAVAEERFADAARLRDQSGVGVLGWWVGRGENDPTGHLLRVTPDFGRYVASAFTPRDIAEMLPALRNASNPFVNFITAASSDSSMLQLKDGGEEEKAEEAGLPVLELFLRPTPDGSGYEQQAAALYAPDAGMPPEDGEEVPQDVAEAAQAMANTLAELIATQGPIEDSVVNIEKGLDEDGNSYMRIEITAAGNQGSDDEDASNGGEGEEVNDDDIRTIDDLAASVGVTEVSEEAYRIEQADLEREGEGAWSAAYGFAGAEGAERGGEDEEEQQEDEEARLARWRQQQGLQEGEGDGESSGLPRSLQEEVAAMTEALLEGAGGSFSGTEGQPAEGDEEAEIRSLSSAANRLGTVLQRAPAKIEWQGRDQFVVTVTEPPPLVAARAQAEAEAAAAAAREAEELQLKKPPVRIIYDGKEQMRRGGAASQQQQQQPGAGPGSSGEDGSSPDAAAASSSSNDDGSSSGGRAADGSLDVEVTGEESDSEQISVFLSQAKQQDVAQQQQQQRQQSQQGAEQDGASLEQDMEAIKEELEAGRRPSQDRINEIARKALGLAIAQGIGAADASGAPSDGGMAALEERTSYRRLRLGDCVKTDPFSGLYVGTFGPHGPELLQVTRQVEGGTEWAVATKLTGDPNVPAGTVSWRAQIGRGSRLPDSMYPPEMGVTGRYKGQGQVAQTGFTNPKWVDGELLVFAPNSPFVRGAQLGFTFDMRANQRYLVVLHRVDLDELFPEEK